jgi:hypothetical protein
VNNFFLCQEFTSLIGKGMRPHCKKMALRAGTRFAEIRLRACQRIGELSRDLEKASANQYAVLLPTNGKEADQGRVTRGSWDFDKHGAPLRGTCWRLFLDCFAWALSFDDRNRLEACTRVGI